MIARLRFAVLMVAVLAANQVQAVCANHPRDCNLPSPYGDRWPVSIQEHMWENLTEGVYVYNSQDALEVTLAIFPTDALIAMAREMAGSRAKGEPSEDELNEMEFRGMVVQAILSRLGEVAETIGNPRPGWDWQKERIVDALVSTTIYGYATEIKWMARNNQPKRETGVYHLGEHGARAEARHAMLCAEALADQFIAGMHTFNYWLFSDEDRGCR